METITSRVVAPSSSDWLDSCAFTSRHGSIARNVPPRVLTHNFEKKLAPEVQAARDRVIFPLIDRVLEPITKPLPPPREIQTDFPPPAPAMATDVLPPTKKIRPLPDSLVAELHSFRQLSSSFYCPETSLDTLPEYILFSLIALLAVAWPILAMLGVMAHS